jgi:cytochrome P450 PksS
MHAAARAALAAVAEPPSSIDFDDPAFRADPYPLYAHLRRERPVSLQRGLRGQAHLVARYDDVMTVLKDQRFANDQRNAGRPLGWVETRLMLDLTSTMVMRDGADHRRLRSLAHQAFTPARVQALAGRIEQLVAELLDRAEPSGRVDLIADLALPLPITVICELIGVRDRDRPAFRRWMCGLVDLDQASLRNLARVIPRMFALFRFVRGLIEACRREPGEDLVSALISAEESGQRLGPRELIATVFLLLLAGHETTVNLIGNGVLALLEHPEQLERLRAQPELIDSAVEELLRFTNPVQMPAPRYVTQDLELSGVALERGSAVMPILASANRDEAKFDRPDDLDLGRSPNRHVAFGFGLHYCVGAPLARMEAKAAILALVKRFPQASLAVPRDQLRWRRSRSLRGLVSLPLRLR